MAVDKKLSKNLARKISEKRREARLRVKEDELPKEMDKDYTGPHNPDQAEQPSGDELPKEADKVYTSPNKPDEADLPEGDKLPVEPDKKYSGPHNTGMAEKGRKINVPQSMMLTDEIMLEAGDQLIVLPKVKKKIKEAHGVEELSKIFNDYYQGDPKMFAAYMVELIWDAAQNSLGRDQSNEFMSMLSQLMSKSF